MGWDDDWERGDRVGDYELVASIGQGGMSRVYEGRHVALGTLVAIKTLRPELRKDATIRARFEREGKATARVHHPHVVKVITVGTHKESPYLVMEFLTGGDLEHHIDTNGPMSVREALAILLPVFSAVQEAHDRGLIHRDLKPANIVLERGRGGAVRPVVVDFGIARLDESPVDHLKTRGSALLGTPSYMAPEQTRGTRSLSAQTDQYALGAILYECLTGAPAFEDESVLHLLMRVAKGDFVPLAEAREGLPEGVTRAAARAMALRPGERFGSVRELALALLPYADEVTRARCASLFEVGGEAVAPEAAAPSERDPTTEVRASARPGTTLGDATRVIDESTEAASSAWSRRGRVIGAVVVALLLATLGAVAFVRKERAPTHDAGPGVSPVPASVPAPSAPRSRVAEEVPTVVPPQPTVVVPPTSATPTQPTRPARGVARRRTAPPRGCVGPHGEPLCL